MNEFRRAVFDAVYNSRVQRGLRVSFISLLVLKHSLRGLFFSWPLYLLSAAGIALPGQYAWLPLILLIPAVLVSGSILLQGLGEEYRHKVRGKILKMADWRGILFGRSP